MLSGAFACGRANYEIMPDVSTRFDKNIHRSHDKIYLYGVIALNRIEDNYNWQRLWQWKFVIEQGGVEWSREGDVKADNAALVQAISLLKENCFPIAMICVVRSGKKSVLETPLWNAVFEFLHNKRGIEMGQKTVYFDHLSATEKTSILNAEIFSIWLS